MTPSVSLSSDHVYKKEKYDELGIVSPHIPINRNFLFAMRL